METVPAKPRPYFVPDELDWEALPRAVQVAVDELVQPAYVELVLQASTELERAAGATFVHLLFLELLEQFDLGREVARCVAGRADDTEGVSPREEELRRHLRLVSQKEKAGKFLMRIHEFRLKHPHVFATGLES